MCTQQNCPERIPHKSITFKNFFFSLLGFLVLCISALMTYLNSVHGIQFPPNQHWFCTIATGVLWASTLSSTLFILSMTFDKVYGIIKPHKAASFNTVKRGKITIICIVIFSHIFNIPYLFIVTNNGPECVTYLRGIEQELFMWLSYFIQFIIPFTSLLSMNSVIIHTLRARSLLKILNNETQGQVQIQTQGQGQKSKTSNTEKQIFIILLLVAFSFFILITPFYAFHLYIEFVDFMESPKAFAEFFLFYQIMHKMYYTNNAINFFLYVISGQKFRKDLINLFKWKSNLSKQKSFSNLSEINAIVEVRN